ncbi:MAG: hypothetical protein IH612_18020, partial [Desulfofustis sp.]|nr:hypothetical protein [Desulfofustis sp.]
MMVKDEKGDSPHFWVFSHEASVMRINYVRSFWLLGVVILCLNLAGYSHSACDPMTYRESQNSAFNKACGHGSVIIKDNNTWVYNESARRRFAMPYGWQDNGLKGAELVAFRIEPSGRQRCHGDGEDRTCVPSYECVLELYIHSDVDIGITGNPVMGLIPWKTSLFHLGQLNPSIREKWEQAFGLQGTQLLVSGEVQDGALKTFGYDTTRKKNLTVVTMFIDGRFTLLSPDVKRSIRFPLADESFHTVELSSSFWKRVISYHQSRPELSENNWRGGEEVDDSLWVYTDDFARQYNLPPSRINKELEGALAVAYRTVPTGRVSCGYFSEADNCTQSNIDNIFDFYISPLVNLPYPSYHGLVKSNWGSSETFLLEQELNNKVTNQIDLWKLQYKLSFIYRSHKSAYKNNEKWFGWDGGYFRQFIDDSAWKNNFSLVTINLHIGDEGYDFDQNYVCFLKAEEWSNKV